MKNFVVFEGGDGSGTTTQLKKLKERIADLGRPPAFYDTFEPTGGPVGRLIRSALQNETALEAETIARLFAADRNEHLYACGGIAERCKRGELVVCDRYTLSSLVYQGIACGETLPESLNSQFPGPELLIFFDVDPETAQKRIKDRPQKEIYEDLDFQQRVRERYLALLPRFRSEGIRTETVDASETPDKVAGEVWCLLQKLPIFKTGTGDWGLGTGGENG